ncbi:mucin-5AC-like isoform X2 [Penaeus japonicus]|uniref:mucin-5AC-like isoform X2 n=1 Tax=Penaeus japonicus TaxID=27405 RepID=UPI001C71220C|nr:mucin-5AC-like isoform X2 [Penaeus japonicus]
MHLVTSLLVTWCLTTIILKPLHVSAGCVAIYNGQETFCTSVCKVPSSASQLPTCATHKNGKSNHGICSAQCDSSYCRDECQLRIAQISSGASQTTTMSRNDVSTTVARFSTTLSTGPVTTTTSSTTPESETTTWTTAEGTVTPETLPNFTIKDNV